MKDETGGSEIEKVVWLKPKMYLFLIDNSEHKKAKSVNKNVVAAISHDDYKDLFLNNECITHSINRIQCKDHIIWIDEFLMTKHVFKIMDMTD